MNAIAHASGTPVRGPKLDNRRVLAGIVDLVIVSLGAVAVLAAGNALSGDASDVRGALSAVILGWALYYYFALESGGGQTVGKKLMKLRVVRADGSPVGMREVAVRTILRVVDGVGAYIVGLIVMLVTGEKRQRLGDLAAGTMVVDASAPALAPAAAAPVVEPAADEPDADDVEAEAAEAPAATATITLPSRPQPPATLADLTAPEAPAVPEMRPFPPEDEPADEVVADDEEPVVEAEPVLDEEPLLDAEPVVDQLPDAASPSIEELARDVEALQAEEPAAEVAAGSQPEEEVEALVEEDGPVTVKSVETVSAIDLIMGAEPAERDADDAEDSAAR